MRKLTLILFVLTFYSAGFRASHRLALSVQTADSSWKAGIAAVDITPQESIWQAGYGARKKPSEGVAQRLSAKALALEDGKGQRLVIVTTDLLGLTKAIADPIATRLEREAGLKRQQLVLTSSHTHGGPIVREYAVFAYGLTPEQEGAVERYTGYLEGRVVEVVRLALKDLAPVRLSFGKGMATFGMNRRSRTSNGYTISPNPQGPVDHEVPVLKIESASASQPKLRGALFSYACHNTTLGGDIYQVHGDYAGYAQEALEREHPGAKALFMSGCAGDTNPHPRGTWELAKQHGEHLAHSVHRALGGPMAALQGDLSTAFELVDLPWATPPSKEELEKRLQGNDLIPQRHARRMLEIIEREGRLPSHYAYPVQVARIGEMVLVALGGEVVVDYTLRLKRELPSDRLWVVAYANDVMGYIPSRRVLEEGGYEGGGSMIFYGRPGPWAPEVEEVIVRTVHELVRETQPH